IFGPPILSTYATASSLTVQATLPRGPNGESIERIIGRSHNRSSKMQILYTLTITDPEGAAQPSAWCYLVKRRVTMETRTVMQREMEEQSSQMSHSLKLSSKFKKKTFKSSWGLQRKKKLFGNETEKMERDVIRSQRLLRKRVDRQMLRNQGYPPPKVTWYKNGLPLKMSEQPWNYSLQQEFGLNTLEIRRCSPADAGEYKVIARSPLGEAMAFGILVVNCLNLEQEARFLNTFPPTWVTEGNDLTLQCSFTPALPQEISWFRDGIQLYPSSTVEIKTADHMTSITLKAAHKEHEGFYTVRLKTWNEVEHSAYIFVKGCTNRKPVKQWSKQTEDEQSPLQRMTWKTLVGSNSWELASPDRVVTSPRFPVFDLVKGEQYRFRVRSINKHGVSDPSEPSTPISLGNPQAIPAPPHSVMAIRDTDTSVLLQWKEPKDKAGILGYYLYYSELGKQDWNTVNNKPLTSTR
ncbi:unnamed protein product, partial [Tetraodon nigroviridis]